MRGEFLQIQTNLLVSLFSIRPGLKFTRGKDQIEQRTTIKNKTGNGEHITATLKILLNSIQFIPREERRTCFLVRRPATIGLRIPAVVPITAVKPARTEA